MKHTIRVDGDKVMVKLDGSMYVEDAADLRERLLAYSGQGYNRFVIDMTLVDYIDSSGLGVLVAIQKRALQQGGEVAITGLKGIVKELFELTRLDRVFTVRG
jgi:anti-sigma B factor antagonist